MITEPSSMRMGWCKFRFPWRGYQWWQNVHWACILRICCELRFLNSEDIYDIIIMKRLNFYEKCRWYIVVSLRACHDSRQPEHVTKSCLYSYIASTEVNGYEANEQIKVTPWLIGQIHLPQQGWLQETLYIRPLSNISMLIGVSRVFINLYFC